MGSNTSAAACISAYDFCLPCDENTVIRNNVFDTSYRYLVSIIKPNTANGPKITDNIWITNSFKNEESNVLGNIPTVACVGQTRNNNDRKNLYANDLSTMQESVNALDLNPKSCSSILGVTLNSFNSKTFCFFLASFSFFACSNLYFP